MDNPILNELDNLSPDAKSALATAHHQIVSSTPQPSPGMAPAPTGAPTPALGAAPPAAAPTAAPAAAPMQPPTTVPALTPPTGMAQDQAELGRLTNPGPSSGSGISQIHNPWIRGPLQALDAIGSGLFPGIAMGIPGTQAHHNLLVHQARANVTGDQEQLNEQSKRNLETAQTAKTTQELNEPAEDDVTPLTTDSGMFGLHKNGGKVTPLISNGKQLQPLEKEDAGKFQKMDDGSIVALGKDENGNPTANKIYQGDPKVETDLAKLEVNGKQHTVIVNKKTGEKIQDLGETGEKAPVVNVNQGNAALDRESSRMAKSHEKAVADANSQLDKIDEAKSMVNGSAEAQALGVPKTLTALVSGAGSGVRITQAELNGIASARGISGNLEGWLNSIQGKGKLTSTQQQQLTQVLDNVRGLVLKKQQIHNDALNTINGAKSKDEINQADAGARQKIMDMETAGGGTPQAGGTDKMINVQIPGYPAKPIHASQLKNLQAKYPNAKVLQ